MRATPRRLAVAISLGLCLAASPSLAQFPGSSESRLGARPGDPGSPGQGADTPLQGGLGPGYSRAPASVTRPASPRNLPAPPPLSPIQEPPAFELPLYGPLDLPTDAVETSPNAWTLDQSIDRLIHNNLELQAQFLEIPQAQADILTASLRANPVLYYDTQLIPYGNFSDERPGGQTQYDLNVTFPLDLNNKRRARTETACRAKRVIEAQFQDAVRLKIGELYAAYVDVLAARETVRYAQSSIQGLDRIVDAARARQRGGEATLADVERVEIQRDAAQVGLAEAEDALAEATRALVPLLNLALAEAQALQFRDPIRLSAPAPPAGETLIQIAYDHRPDLAAYRLGILYATADLRLAERERFQDVFLLVQPYTFQNNEPFNRQSAHSWGVGVTIPLPLFDRNQGRIQRAALNIRQTQVELATLQQQIATEVLQAERRYNVTKASVERIENDLLPKATRIRDNALRRYSGGETDIVDFLNAQRDYNDLVRQFRDTLIRHRRAMLDLNTAAGTRLLP
jgi:cobalt-zinc-cadmium efflux system outer membrane protein